MSAPTSKIIFESGMTVAQLKELVSGLPDTLPDGTPAMVYVLKRDEALPIRSVEPLEPKTRNGVIHDDLLFGL